MRGVRARFHVVWLATLALAACASPPPAAAGLFQDARALAATPDGTLWVVDADRVVALRDGAIVRTLGGLGTGADAFLDPVAIDPTNGLAVFVADRAGGTVLRFTAEGRLAQTIPIPDVDPSRPVRQQAGDRGDEAARARPVAVAAGSAGRLYVLDAGRRHVLRLDPTLGAGQATQGAVEAVLGASGPGALRDPVALAVDREGTLWVADAGRNALVGFDPFGAVAGVVGLPDLERLASVAPSPGGLVVAGRGGVALVRDGVADRVAIPSPEPVRGAAWASGGVVVLTARELVGPLAVD